MSSAQTSQQNLVEYLLTVDTPTLCNAIEQLKLRPRHEGFTPLGIRSLFPEMGRMCGWAVTAQVETVSQSWPAGREVFGELFRAVSASVKPVVVAFQEVGAHAGLSAHSGEVMATIFQRLGGVGLVTDSGVRDIDEVRALGFQYFARGTVASHANFRIVRVNVPIQVGGMMVRPGSLLHGDINGLVEVPEQKRDQLAAAVEGVRTSEGPLMEYVRSAEFDLEQLIRRFFH